MPIARLGYVGIATQSLDAWRTVATDILRAELRDITDSGAPALALRIDEMPQRCIIVETDSDGVIFAGWEVDDASDFDILVADIASAGCSIEAADDGLAAARGVTKIARFRDPDGYLNELFWGAKSAPYAAPSGHGGYVTGSLGLGHIMRHCARYPDMVRFYSETLGFRLSDKIVWDEADASFLRCNARHHSLALINESLGMKSGDTNHIMLEFARQSDVLAAYEEVIARGYPMIMTLGRHTNCKTLSFYFVGPSGFGIEIGHGSCLVDEEEWEVAQYDRTKIWGHLLPFERVKEMI